MGRDTARYWRAAAAAGAAVMLGGIGYLGWRLSSPAPAEVVASEAIAAQGQAPADTGNSSNVKLLVVYVS
ncbi:MAG: hypothetical protein WAT58_01040, partial [Candidatus Dormiibacterota bacterium]